MLKKLGSKLKEQKGFTLIELLAVIVILGIIAAIAIPAISGVINKSEVKASAQEGVQIVNAAKMYVAENPETPLTALTTTQLNDYLDHVEDSAYTITLTKAGTSGKFSFTLKGHSANLNLRDNRTLPLSEQNLINAANGEPIGTPPTTTP
jgi:type IV pilus assembly protein PilA